MVTSYPKYDSLAFEKTAETGRLGSLFSHSSPLRQVIRHSLKWYSPYTRRTDKGYREEFKQTGLAESS
jgi:hypothetical protein